MPDSGDRSAKKALARRLRELRTAQWPDVMVTQANLAAALSAHGGRVTGPSISSWEKIGDPVVPPVERLTGYATFFATRRSMEGEGPRLLRPGELTDDEAAVRDELEAELLSLREAATSADAARGVSSDPWRFADGGPITIICGEVSKEQREFLRQARPEHPTLAHGEMYYYADIDTLFELCGRLRASNPQSEVRVVRWKDVHSDDLLTHLVVVGRGDRGPIWGRVVKNARLPVAYVGLDAELDEQVLELQDGQRYGPELSDNGELLSDVGLFYRGPSPFRRQRTLTMCHEIGRAHV